MDTTERIFALMDEKGLTAAEVSKGSGIPKSTIAEWKKGRSKPSADALAKLADYFDVTTDYLLGRSNLRERVNFALLNAANEAGVSMAFPSVSVYREN